MNTNNLEFASECFLTAETWEQSRLEWHAKAIRYLQLNAKARAMRAFGVARQRAAWRDLSLSRAAKWSQR
jgi:hypothetical protein